MMVAVMMTQVLVMTAVALSLELMSARTLGLGFSFIFLVVVSSVAVRVGWQGVGRARGGQRPVWICGDDDDRWSWLWRLDRKRD
ncbi:putative peroxidase 18 [Iris pallida]|uniref:Peroxidase 18 n=1 Tax=Iris pallida TaxID=29817 RepID=A0AAX6GD40_IRIPA|nr:putative peroxidase 18 [Iris pallida]